MPADILNESIIMEGVEASLEDYVKASCTTFDTLATSSSSESETMESTGQENILKVVRVSPEKASTIRPKDKLGEFYEEVQATVTISSSFYSDSDNSTPAVSPTLSDLKTVKDKKENASDSQSSSFGDPASKPQCSQEQENSFVKELAQSPPFQKKHNSEENYNTTATPSTINTSSNTTSSNPTLPSPVESLLSFVHEPGFNSSQAVNVLSELAVGIVNPDESTLSNPIGQGENDQSEPESEGDEIMGKIKPKPVDTTRPKGGLDVLDPTPICSNRKVPRSVPLQTVPSMTRVSAMARMRHMRNNGTITPATQSPAQSPVQSRNPSKDHNTPQRGPMGDKYKVKRSSRKSRIERVAKEEQLVMNLSFHSEGAVEEKDPQSDCRSRSSRDWDEEESAYGGTVGERSVDHVDTGDCGVGLLSQPLTEMLWGVLMGPETPKMEEQYYSDSDSLSSRSSGSSECSSDSDYESGRGKRRGREKRSEHKVYTNSSQKHKQRSKSRIFDTTNSKRGLGTSNSIKGFMDKITTDGIDLKLHQATNREGPLPPPSHACLVLTTPDSENFTEPHLEWQLPKRSPPSLKNKSRSTCQRVSLFDIQSVQKATESIQLPSFPTLRNPEQSILINFKNGVLLFEAETESDARQAIHGLRWIVARLSFNLIMGNRTVVAEMLPMLIQDDSENFDEFGNGTLPDRLMGDVTNQLVEKSLSRLSSIEEKLTV